jgi:hypothetical protein
MTPVSCQVCGTPRNRLKKDGTFPKHNSNFGPIPQGQIHPWGECPGTACLPAPAEDKLRAFFTAACVRDDGAAIHKLGNRLIAIQPNWGDLQDELGALEKIFRSLSTLFWFVTTTKDYGRCPMLRRRVEPRAVQVGQEAVRTTAMQQNRVQPHGCHQTLRLLRQSRDQPYPMRLHVLVHLSGSRK